MPINPCFLGLFFLSFGVSADFCQTFDVMGPSDLVLVLLKRFPTKFRMGGTPFATRIELGQFLVAWGCFFSDLDAFLTSLIDETAK